MFCFVFLLILNLRSCVSIFFFFLAEKRDAWSQVLNSLPWRLCAMVTGLHKKWFRLINKSKGSLSIKARLTYLNLLQHRFLAKEYHRCLCVNCQPFTRKTCHNLKWFLIECRKTKSKVLMTRANQKGYRQSGEPINSNELIKSLRKYLFRFAYYFKIKANARLDY